MTTIPFTAIGFDLDGTLIDSNRDLTPAINYALQLAGRDPVPPHQTHSLIGGGGRLMLSRAFALTGETLPDEEIEPHFANFFAYYSEHIADNSVPYPGCLEALDRLAEMGCTLAVVTNKVEALAVKLLDALGMSHRFATIIGGDTMPRSKPHPDMLHEAIARCGGGPFAMIGDSTFDVRAARAAGVPVVALSFGYNDLPAQELGADAVIDHFDELVPALSSL